MPVLCNIGQLAVCPADTPQDELKLIEGAALAWKANTIKWVGKEPDLPNEFADTEQHDAHGKLVIPGLIDCHTHLAFGGWRPDEFEMRVLGRSYLEIAHAGGGITSSMKHTRAASEEALIEKSLGILDEMATLGVTTVECKSGYGLSYDDELKTLRAYRALEKQHPISLISTFLGGHIIPPEYKENRSEYISLLTDKLIPTIAAEGLAEFCDVFVEDSAITPDEARQIFQAARDHCLRAKLHADQLTDCGGAALAAEVGAVSADHLEQASDASITAMKEAGVVAVTLPLASLYTFQKPLDARRFLKAGVPVAVATDFNPGSAPSFHLPLAMMLACTMNRLTPREALKGATIIAAQALARADQVGSLEPGKAADFAVIDASSVNHWLYHFRANACVLTVKGGKIVYDGQDL